MDPNAPAPQGENVPPVVPVAPAPEPVAPPAPEPVIPPTMPSPPVDQPPAPPTSPQTPPEPVKKTSPIFTIALILLLLTILVLGGYYVWTNYLGGSLGKSNNVSPTPAPVTIATPVPTTDPTLEWNSYTNSELGLSFKYPTRWEVFDGKFIDTTPLKPDKNISIGNEGTDVFLLITKIYKSNLTARQWWNDVGAGKFNELVSGGDNSVELPKFAISSSIIGGQDAVVAKGSINASQMGDTILSIISYNGYIYMFEQFNDENVEVSSLVLSTFKFIEATPVASPTSSPSATAKP